VARSNHDKTKKRLERIIPWRPYHLCLDVTVQKERSPCHYAGKVADDIVVVLIFNIVAIEKTIPPFLFVIAEEEEEINPQYQEIWHGETLILRTQSTRKLFKMDPHSL